MIRFLLAVSLLTLIYVTVLASASPWDIAIGAGLSAALLLAFRRFIPGGPTPSRVLVRRLLAFWPFLAMVIWDILVGAWTVIRISLHIRPLARPGIVAVPIEERTRTGVAVSALCNAISPGTILVDVDWKRGVMLIHSIDASDPDGLREHLQTFYRRYQRHVFP